MTAEGIGLGAFAPQGWKMELHDAGDAQAQWETCKRVALAAVAGGFDSVWVYDHFHTIPAPSDDPVFECWTTMAALAEATTTVRLGQMVGCNSYRSPALLAKITSCVDVISGGRLDWGVGAGWYWHEYAGYGFEYADARTRIGMLAEAVEIVTSMWTRERTDFAGDHYTLADARCDPKPLQKPRPPVWIGGSGEQLTLKVVARLADCSNFGGKTHEFAHKCEVLRRHCDAVARDYDDVTKTMHVDCIVGETEADVARKLDARMAVWEPVTQEPADSYRQGHLVGTPEQILERIDAYADLGCRYFVLWFPDYPSTDGLDLFADAVLPAARHLR